MAAEITDGLTRATTRVMSCDAEIAVHGDDPAIDPGGLADRAVRRLHELEARWSRFLADSEVSLLNRSDGGTTRVSSDTVTLVEALVRAWHATGGDFDPSLLAPLVGLGYAASRDDRTLRTSLAPDTAPRGRVGDVLVDTAGGSVAMPTGTVLDPGGIGKGLAADLVVGELLAAGARGALVEIGGDLRVGGAAPDDTGWTIAIDDGVGDARTVRLSAGGVATSTTRLRTWSHGGRTAHHLLDPRTLAPTDGDVVTCSVLAGTAAWAEAFTKVAFVRGAAEAIRRYDELGLAASVTTSDGVVHTSAAWERFVS